MRLTVPMHRPGAHCFVVAKKRGNSRGAKGAGHPRQDGVNGQPEELLVLMGGGSLLQGGTSRMNREVHVRICGSCALKARGIQSFEIMTAAKLSSQPRTESCVVSGNG